jgi:hypothetical protein
MQDIKTVRRVSPQISSLKFEERPSTNNKGLTGYACYGMGHNHHQCLPAILNACLGLAPKKERSKTVQAKNNPISFQ